MDIVKPNAAGIDVSPKEMQVCVPSDRDENCNRRFGVYTADLREISNWLRDCGIETVAMESTGVYWLPLFTVLQDAGFEVILVNARDVKNISGKKTDVSDAEWLMTLHRHGLLRPCFQPENIAREIRDYTRHRDNLIRSASREVLHLQKAMEQMNLKLDNVFSDILGKSGMSIVEAIIGGERDAKVLASLADPRCKKSRAEIELSLEANWSEVHIFEMKQCKALYDKYQEMIAECDSALEKISRKYAKEVDLPEKELLRSGKKASSKNSIAFDVESAAFEIWGVNVMNLPGMSKSSLLRLMGEIGADIAKKFPDVHHFVSWANLVPNNKISGGALLSSKVPKKKNPVGIIFRQCANALHAAKNPMGDYFRHMRAKGGHLQAMVATGKKLATIFYTMVTRGVEYDETVYSNHRHAQLERTISSTKARLKRLQQELKNCVNQDVMTADHI